MKFHHKGDHAARRRAEYPPLADQLDAVWVVIAHLQTAGVDLPPEGVAMLERVKNVKRKFPKGVRHVPV